MMVALGSVRVLEILSQATNVVAKGEVLQLMNAGNPDIGESDYLAVIQRKTAKLFEAAAQLGAVLGDAAPEREAALPPTGSISGSRSSSSTTCSTIRATSRRSARISATISPKAR